MPTVDLDGLRVSYIDSGSGVPLVFVPGLVGSKEWFRYQVSGLADDYRTIAYDLRAARGRVSYSLGLLANDLARLLSRLHVGSAAVVGHEFGAMIALSLAISHPERVLAMVLSSAAPSFSQFSDEDMLDCLAPGEVRVESALARLWRRLLGRGREPEVEEEGLSYLASNNAGIDRSTLRARLKLMRETDLAPKLADVSIPALIVAGSREQPRVLAGSQRLAELLPDSSIEVIEGADRFSFYARHDLFNAALDDFLRHKIRRL